jgi:hypothetical protein
MLYPKRASQEFKGSQRLFPPFIGKIPWIGFDKLVHTLVSSEDNYLDFHMVRLEKLVHRNTLTMVGRTIVAGYTIKPTSRKVTHPSTIMTLDGLTSKLPWDSCGSLEFL